MATLTEDDNNPGGQDDNEDIVIVETPPEKNQGDSDDARLNERDDDDQPGDANDPEREAIRERRRLEKLERKKRRDEAIGRDKLELDFLRKRNDDLERRVMAQEVRSHKSDLTQFDAHIAQAQNEAQMAERVIAKAVAAGNGEDVTQAMRYRDQALQKVQQLAFAKQQAAQQKPTPRNENMDDRTMLLAKEFLEDNKWYDPQGRDEESAIVLAIDQAMHREGFKPDTEEYWDELRDRAARRLPERFGKQPAAKEEPTRQARQTRGGPAIGSGREHAPTSTRNEVYVSPERKQALIDAGVWDDPVLRQKYVKRYSEYDKANRA